MYSTNEQLIVEASQWGSNEKISLNGFSSGDYVLKVFSFMNEASGYSLQFDLPTPLELSLKDDPLSAMM